ncbi:uncharacterized protein [Palaemon carinicauda]|uniref:uncharacterized protein n=1 Tax=Palaemon carinicauda TaxID=392227 RepID=UPI0035B5BE10
METPEGESRILRIAKAASKDLTQIRQIKVSNGIFPAEENEIKRGAQANVESSIGQTESFPVNVVLHQGSALSPYLYNLIMDVVTQGIRDQSPWCTLFADDVILCSTRLEVVEEKLEKINGK